MADWRDVMAARAEADRELESLNVYAGRVEDGDRDGSLSVLLAANVIAKELRALATLIDYKGVSA